MNTQSLATLMNVNNNELLKQTEIKITDNDVTIRISNESLERDMNDDDCLYIITYMEMNKQQIEAKFPNKTIDWGFNNNDSEQLNEIEAHVESQIELLYSSLAEEFDLPYGDVTPHHTVKMNELKENLKMLMDEYVSTNLPTKN